MAFGFPARFRESRTFRLADDDLVTVVKSAFENLGWQYQILRDREFEARSPFAPWSWGEALHVRILPGGQIQAESKSHGRVPAVFDFGKNRSNVETFFALVEHGIRQEVYLRPLHSTAQESVPSVRQAVPKNSFAGTLFGGCLIATIILALFTYFISAVIGLLTGNLYLPSRGHGGNTIHGAWARIISVIIFLVFAWILIWMRRKHRASQSSWPQ